MHARTNRARIDDAALHRVTRLLSETLDETFAELSRNARRRGAPQVRAILRETAGDSSARETAVADPALPLAHGRSGAPREEHFAGAADGGARETRGDGRASETVRRRRAGLALAGLAAAALAGAASGAPAVGPTIASEAGSPPGRLVDVGPHRLHIHCTGRGSPAVVFESGLGGTSLDWARVQPEVSRLTRACSYDRAGYGWSEAGPEPRDARRIAGELDRLLDSADVPPPYVLVGHSFGGLVVRLLAARAERGAVSGLVLVDATHEHQFRRMESAGARLPLAPTGRRFVIANHWQVPNALPEGLKPAARRLALTRKAARALHGELGSLRHSARQVGSIRRLPDAPVIVLARSPRRDAGGGSRLDEAWLDLQRELARRMKNGSLQVVPGSGHYLHLDRPQQVVGAIRTIVDRHRAGRTPAAHRRRDDRPKTEGASPRRVGEARRSRRGRAR